MNTEYVIYYTNLNRRERTPAMQTLEEAQRSAEFLLWQGAKKVRIVNKSSRKETPNDEIEGD